MNNRRERKMRRRTLYHSWEWKAHSKKVISKHLCISLSVIIFLGNPAILSLGNPQWVIPNPIIPQLGIVNGRNWAAAAVLEKGAGIPETRCPDWNVGLSFRRNRNAHHFNGSLGQKRRSIASTGASAYSLCSFLSIHAWVGPMRNSNTFEVHCNEHGGLIGTT